MDQPLNFTHYCFVSRWACMFIFTRDPRFLRVHHTHNFIRKIERNFSLCRVHGRSLKTNCRIRQAKLAHFTSYLWKFVRCCNEEIFCCYCLLCEIFALILSGKRYWWRSTKFHAVHFLPYMKRGFGPIFYQLLYMQKWSIGERRVWVAHGFIYINIKGFIFTCKYIYVSEGLW